MTETDDLLQMLADDYAYLFGVEAARRSLADGSMSPLFFGMVVESAAWLENLKLNPVA